MELKTLKQTRLDSWNPYGNKKTFRQAFFAARHAESTFLILIISEKIPSILSATSARVTISVVYG